MASPRNACLALLIGCWCGVAGAEAGADALAWLTRVSAAAQRLSYAGTFIYQCGKRTETSRIVHLSDASGEHERLETLDGAPREVVRANGEVRFYLPRERMVIADRVVTRRFPAWGQLAPSALTEHYRARMGEVDRVAGLDAHQIVLEPKDGMRFGHVLWVEPASGLLLRSRIVDPQGATVEQFSFSEVNIGAIERSRLQSRYESQSGDWKRVNAHGQVVAVDESPWEFRNALPGFRQVSTVRRTLKRDAGEAFHMVFSDGLATVSVFVEPLSGRGEGVALGESVAGPTRIYKRAVGTDYLVTALGEVPVAALRRIADGVEPRRR